MNVLCIGGGPTGLYSAILHKKHFPKDRVVVAERNKSDDTFGWGVVFSDATMENLIKADRISAEHINQSLNHWDDIEIFFKNEKMTSTGHGFIGIGRLKLLQILQQRCLELGVELCFETNISDENEAINAYQADMVLACNGINSFIRNKYASAFNPDIEERKCRFVWYGTHRLFDAFTFIFKKTRFGWVAVHAYRFDRDTSTFIIEMPEKTWLNTGLSNMEQEPAIRFCENLFEEYLQGNKLLNNAHHLRGSSNWIRFPRIVCPVWHTWQNFNGKNIPVALMGDASHTAHFSIGSGTKLGLEDAICLNNLLVENDKDLKVTLTAYETERRIEVAKIQNAAANSTWWFENVDIHENLPPLQFYYSLLTRSQRLSHENLYKRDPDWITNFEEQFSGGTLPFHNTLKIGELLLKNRCALNLSLYNTPKDNSLSEFYASQASHGCGLIISETIDVASLNGTKVCPSDNHNGFSESILKGAVKSCHADSAAFALVLGYGKEYGSSEIGEIRRSEIQNIVSAFSDAVETVLKINPHLLVLNFADGNIINRFLSPLTNNRQDEYGGDPLNRSRLALEILKTILDKIRMPVFCKINAAERVAGGINIEESLIFCEQLEKSGINGIFVSSGNGSEIRPKLGRMYNGCYADEIKNRIGIPTMVSGNISDLDQVNTMLAAGRADIIAFDHPDILSQKLDNIVSRFEQTRNSITQQAHHGSRVL